LDQRGPPRGKRKAPPKRGPSGVWSVNGVATDLLLQCSPQGIVSLLQGHDVLTDELDLLPHPAGVCAPLGALHVQTVDHPVDLRPDAVEAITKVGCVGVRDMITNDLQLPVLSVQSTEDYGACDGRDDQAEEAERRRDGVLEQFGGHGVSPFGWAPAGVVSSASAVEDRSSASSMRFRRRSMSRR